MTRSIAIEPKQRTEGRKKFLHLMFTTAMEGGIGYWSEAHEYKWSKHPDPEKVAIAAVNPNVMEEDLDNFYARICNNEDDWGVEAAYQPNTENGDIHPSFTPDSHMIRIVPDEILTIDIDVMEKGWNLFLDAVIAATKSEDPDAPYSSKYYRRAVIQWLTDGEDGDSDANVADIVVQLGLFGEGIYG